MIEFIVVVRKPGSNKVDYSLEFRAPAVPAIGSYLSIERLDKMPPFGEDLIVRQVWWRFRHSETHATQTTEKPGELIEIFVECDPATGPYSSDEWRGLLDRARARGISIEEFDVSRSVFRG